MVGLLVLLVVIAYVWTARSAVKRLQSRKAKWIVIAGFVLVPTWDIAPGYFYFHHLCSTEGGEKIYKTMAGIEGFFFDSYASKDWLQSPYSYKFIEMPTEEDMHKKDHDPRKAKGFLRLSLNSKGEPSREQVGELKSRYSVQRDKSPRMYFALFQIEFFEYTVSELQTGEVIGKQTEFIYGGGWLSRFLSRFGGTGHPDYESCPLTGDPIKFVVKALKPSK